MHIKLLVSAAAIALVAGVGSVSAAERFSTLEGIPAEASDVQLAGAVEAMSPEELDAVKGARWLSFDFVAKTITHNSDPGAIPGSPIGALRLTRLGGRLKIWATKGVGFTVCFVSTGC